MTPDHLRMADAHCHLADLAAHEDPISLMDRTAATWAGLSSCHSPQEWEVHRTFADQLTSYHRNHILRVSIGVHPLAGPRDFLHDIIRLARRGDPLVAAIGECGFDRFAGTLAAETAREQALTFEAQADLARETGLPLVIHLRKATPEIFARTRLLKGLRSVIFHSWPSPFHEAKDLLARGINAWFSFGTPLLRGSRKARESLASLPEDRILMETDAPWQTLKGRSFTSLGDLPQICSAAAELRNMASGEMAELAFRNFLQALGQMS